jgi:hypothetical protein
MQRFDFRQENAWRHCDKLSQPRGVFIDIPGAGVKTDRDRHPGNEYRTRHPLGIGQIAARQFAAFPTPGISTRIRAHQ